MIFVEKIDVNLDGCRDYAAIIAIIDAAINELLPFLAVRMMESNVVEYSLNTGPSQVTTKLKTNEDFTNVIGNLEKMREQYVMLWNRREGNGVVQLQDAQNFMRGCGY